jgi:hypothetical protein
MFLASRPCLHAAVLQVLALADIGVGEADKVQLHGLVHALIVGPGQLAQLDFDANYIGELPCSLLSLCAEMILFREERNCYKPSSLVTCIAVDVQLVMCAGAGGSIVCSSSSSSSAVPPPEL